MRKVFFLSCTMALAIASIAQPIPEKLDTLISAYHREDGYNGTVLVARGGAVLLEKGYGYKNKQARSLNDRNTIFQIGSITKQFTSALILQLMEQGKLSLSDKLSKFFPDYPHGDSISIENLLTHESGVWNYTNDAPLMMSRAARPIDRDSLIAYFKYKPLGFSPGTKYSYSNSGYVLLGYIIEKVSGKPWFRVMHERIFGPLHMDHSGFDFAGLKSPDKATGYNSPSSDQPALVVDSSVSFAAGSIYTTVEDLYKWDRALYTGRIISEASLQKAFTPHLGKYGYGWMMDSVYGKKVVEHGGGIPGFLSFIFRVPEDQTCIIIFDNMPIRDPGKMAGAINALLNGKDYTIPRPKVVLRVDTVILKQYAGKYELAPGFVMTVTLENGKLMAQAGGQPKLELFAEKENVFYPREIDAHLEFVRGADSSVEKLILNQGGQVRTANRIK
ncbi:MAG: serine hydrolase [Bacteroidota bacterium]|nr:serine hydrolase [Bacteroidota bacterium]